MNTITVDIGNTRSKYVVWNSEGEILETGSEVLMFDLFQKFPGSQMSVSCVGKLDEWVPDDAHFISVSGDFPFGIEIDQPETLGTDRLAGILGAFKRFPGQDLLVIDLGSCITYDYLLDGEPRKRYVGGAISPGLRFRYLSMSEHTAALPYLGDTSGEYLKDSDLGDIEKNTSTAMHSGVILGFLDEISNRIERFLEGNERALVVFTGGDAELVHEKLGNRWKSKIFVEPWLVHYGLYHAL